MNLAMRTTAPPGLEVGTVVEGYVIQSTIGHPVAAELRYAASAPDGGPATVVTPAYWNPDRRRRSQFRRLASRRVELEHPAVIAGRAFGECRGRPYLITDPYPASTFSDMLEREAPLPARTVVAMLAPVADAMDAAHGHGLVHRALTSESLLVEEGRLQLGSFAPFAPDYDASLGMVPPGDLRYRPPEELRGEALGPAANVYSLTAIVFHALAGAPPFAGERGSVTYSHLLEAPPRASERVPELDEAIDDVIAWGMAKEPSERPPTATALLRALDEVLDTGRTAIPARPRERPASALPAGVASLPRPRRRLALPVAAILVAAVVGTLVAALLNPFGGGEDSRPDPAVAAVQRLDARRLDLRGQLAVADTPTQQAAIAARLASAYLAAADAAGPGPFARAARSAGDAYTELAAASEAGSAREFADASAAVRRAELRLRTRR